MIKTNSNRIKNKQCKPGKYWCRGCDANIVGDYKKCSNCGHRNGTKRFKKSDTIKFDQKDR